MRPMIVVHGGAGDLSDSCVPGRRVGIRVAVRAGYQQLMQKDNALDAVEAAVISMEKDVYFNAGYGSVLNENGKIEMEASIMRGADLNVGAVALLNDFLHPISIARKVLTDSPHAMLAAEGAKMFALEKGFQTVPEESLICQHARDALNDFLKHGKFGTSDTEFKHKGGVGTVGAVAVDSQGRVAAATSTGGLIGKAAGRISDSFQIGSGTYADDLIGGVCATGHGESILKYCLGHSIIKLMEGGVDAKTATKEVVNAMTVRLKNTAGAIALSKDGDVGIHFSSTKMPWAYVKNNKIFYGIHEGEVLEEDLN